MEPRLKVIGRMRELADQFVVGEIGVAEFSSTLQDLLGSHFDPLDWTVEGLPADAQALVRFLSEWTGGEFGETEERIPRNPKWRYGVDSAAYAWVDESKYRQDFAAAYLRLQRGRPDGAAV